MATSGALLGRCVRLVSRCYVIHAKRDKPAKSGLCGTISEPSIRAPCASSLRVGQHRVRRYFLLSLALVEDGSERYPLTIARSSCKTAGSWVTVGLAPSSRSTTPDSSTEQPSRWAETWFVVSWIGNAPPQTSLVLAPWSRVGSIHASILLTHAQKWQPNLADRMLGHARLASPIYGVCHVEPSAEDCDSLRGVGVPARDTAPHYQHTQE